MGYDLEMEKRQMELEEYRAKTMRILVEKTLPITLGSILVALVVCGIIWAVWSTETHKSDNRLKEVEAAAAAGLVEQLYKEPGYNGTRSMWVRPDQYQAKIIDNWD